MTKTAITSWIGDPDHPVEERLRETAAFIDEAIGPRGASPERDAGVRPSGLGLGGRHHSIRRGATRWAST